mgnify:CR=1 FL=1
MRFFIALEIPAESQAQLENVQEKLKDLISRVRLTDSNKLHLTLAFVGEQPDSLQPDLIEIIKQAAQNVPSFEITPAYIDGFPSIHNPNTIWVGVKGDIDKLLLIREWIKDGLENLKLIVDERRFTPHIAIAKVKDLHIDSRTENTLASIMAKNFDPIKITSIKLFESIPEDGLHRHNTLAEIKLL